MPSPHFDPRNVVLAVVETGPDGSQKSRIISSSQTALKYPYATPGIYEFPPENFTGDRLLNYWLRNPHELKIVRRDAPFVSKKAKHCCPVSHLRKNLTVAAGSPQDFGQSTPTAAGTIATSHVIESLNSSASCHNSQSLTGNGVVTITLDSDDQESVGEIPEIEGDNVSSGKEILAAYDKHVCGLETELEENLASKYASKDGRQRTYSKYSTKFTGHSANSDGASNCQESTDRQKTSLTEETFDPKKKNAEDDEDIDPKKNTSNPKPTTVATFYCRQQGTTELRPRAFVKPIALRFAYIPFNAWPPEEAPNKFIPTSSDKLCFFLLTQKYQREEMTVLDDGTVLPAYRWLFRRWLFSKFDQGISLDVDGYMDVTPEPVAIYVAYRMASSVAALCTEDILSPTAAILASPQDKIIVPEEEPQSGNGSTPEARHSEQQHMSDFAAPATVFNDNTSCKKPVDLLQVDWQKRVDECIFKRDRSKSMDRKSSIDSMNTMVPERRTSIAPVTDNVVGNENFLNVLRSPSLQQPGEETVPPEDVGGALPENPTTLLMNETADPKCTDGDEAWSSENLQEIRDYTPLEDIDLVYLPYKSLKSAVDDRCVYPTYIAEGCAGYGGNSIQLARYWEKVFAVEINPQRVAKAKHNATIYNVDRKIEFICQDFVAWAAQIRERHAFTEDSNQTSGARMDAEKKLIGLELPKDATGSGGSEEPIAVLSSGKNEEMEVPVEDSSKSAAANRFGPGKSWLFPWIFISPPWGGDEYEKDGRTILNDVKTCNFREMIQEASKIGMNLCVYGPANQCMAEVLAIAQDDVAECGLIDIDRIYIGSTRRIKTSVLFFLNESLAQLVMKASLSRTTGFSAVAKALVKDMDEPFEQLESFEFLLEQGGYREICNCYAEALEIWQQGGLHRIVGSSPRTRGGTFFQVLKERLPSVHRALNRLRRDPEYKTRIALARRRFLHKRPPSTSNTAVANAGGLAKLKRMSRKEGTKHRGHASGKPLST